MTSPQLTPQAGARYVLDHPANRDRRLRAAARLAVWLFVRRFARSPHTIRWVAGRRLRWYPDSISVGNAWLFRLLEWHDMRFVMDVMRPGDLFIDVGSNVGVYTLLATTCPGVEVLAFEPGRLARDRLEEHLDLNHVRDRVEVSPFVLSDHTGEIQFTVGRDVTNHVVTDVTTSDGTETLPVRRLDDVVAADAFKRPVLLKVDAEGHDLRVLLGARRLLEEVRPPIIVEWNDPEIISLLVPLGYRPYIYSPDNRTLTESDWATSGTSNVLAIADRAAVEERLRDR